MLKMFQVIQSLEVFKINGQDTNNIYKQLGDLTIASPSTKWHNI